MALAASSVASLTGSEVDIALGASSPAIVSGWHDRPWDHSASRMQETIGALRPILAGQRSDHDGDHVRTHGFRLRHPLPDARDLRRGVRPSDGARRRAHADEVVVNLVPPERSAPSARRSTRKPRPRIRPAPTLAVWLACRARPRPRGPGAAGRAAGGLPRASRLRRDVRRARVRRHRAPSTHRARPRSELARASPTNCSNRSAPSARPTKWSRGSRRTSTPARTSSGSCPPPRRIPRVAPC